MKDRIINDLVVYESILILQGKIKIDKNEKDDKILKEYYKFVKIKRRKFNGTKKL